MGKLTDEEKKDRKRKADKEWRESHPERIKEIKKRWRDKNADKIKESSKEYFKNNQESFRRRAKEWRENNREKCIEHTNKFKESNPERFKFLEKRNYIKRRYGVSVEYITNLMDTQKGLCAICGESLVSPDSKKSFQIDHDHKTNKVRGLLCYRCNYATEYFINFNKEILSYLKQESIDNTKKVVLNIRKKDATKNEELLKYYNRVSNIRWKYNISEEDITSVMDKQKGCCPICNNSLINPEDAATFHIDHNHKTKEVRGLLCKFCNTSLGKVQEVEKEIVKYLEEQ